MRQQNPAKHYLDALRKREKHLAERLKGKGRDELSFDRLEKAALGWAIANLQHMATANGEVKADAR